MENYTILSNDDITNTNISAGAFRLYCLLLSYCYSNKNTCFPSQATLAEKLNKKSIRTIQRYLKELVSANLVKIKHRGSISNLYTLLKKQVTQKVNDAVNKARNAYNSVKQSFKQAKKDNFNNFKQRRYNYSKLEELLLNGGSAEDLHDCLLE